MRKDEFLLHTERVQALESPTKRNQGSVYNFLYNSNSIQGGEKEWILRRDDLAALSHNAERGWINGFLEDCLIRLSPRFLLCRIMPNRCTKPPRDQRLRSLSGHCHRLLFKEAISRGKLMEITAFFYEPRSRIQLG